MFTEDGADDAASDDSAPAATPQIYGSKIESEMSLKTVEFPIETADFDERSELSASEVEEVVRAASADLSDGAIRVAALHYVDPQRFGDALAAQGLTAAYDVRIVPENVSVAARRQPPPEEVSLAEDVVPFTEAKEISVALAEAGYAGDDAKAMAAAIAARLNATSLKAGTVLSLDLEVRGDLATIIRVGVYDRARHILTIARDDRGKILSAPEPDVNPAIATAFDDTPMISTRGQLPTAYDGIYQAAYSHGMSRSMTRQLIKLLAADVDFQSRLSPTDQIRVFFSEPDESDQMSESSELLFVSATFGGNTRNFYRFRMDDGSIDYYDEEGRSAKQFLMRKPVPKGPSAPASACAGIRS